MHLIEVNSYNFMILSKVLKTFLFSENVLLFHLLNDFAKFNKIE